MGIGVGVLGVAFGMQVAGLWVKIKGYAVDLASPDELMEIAEVDEGFCSRVLGGSPPSISVSVPSGGGKSTGKTQRRGGSKTSKQPGGRTMSENLDLLSLKRLTLTSSQSVPKTSSTLTSSQSVPKTSSTLTSSQSVPKPNALSLSRTASAVFSRSFEQVSNALGGGHAPPEHSRCSLQEDRLTPEHHSPPHKHRSPSFSIHLSTDL
ncbi:hypothetical protein AGOR_G00045760 [Albula goreensis]|uniref:Uncharacterized protein n=1 Tax=Albula goreensis TaxID=1534307 RepID=A0A8T3E2P0_9TELE|nr:hypothetical protein AGOR_G00045760 [Albula goreensis]